MGFSSVVSQIIFIVIFLILIYNVFFIQERQIENQVAVTQAQQEKITAILNTDFEMQNVTYNDTTNILSIQLQNTGSNIIDVDYLDFYIDGQKISRDNTANQLSFCYNFTAVRCGEIGFGDYNFELQNIALLYHLNNDSKYGESESLIYDFSGNANDASATNINITTTAKYTKAIACNGENSEITIPSSGSLDFTVDQNYTWAFWMYSENISKEQTILAKTNGVPTTGTGYSLKVLDSKFVFHSQNNNVTTAQPVTLKNNTWYFVAVTYQNETINIYIDANKTTTVTNFNDPTSDTSSDMTLGFTPESGGSQYFNGIIDELTIYTQLLSANQINTLYMKGYEQINPKLWDAQEYSEVDIYQSVTTGVHTIKAISDTQKSATYTFEVS